MSKRERRGDWPIELEVLDEGQASTLTHDAIPIPTRQQEIEHKEQVARDKSHPAYGLRNKD